MEKQELFEMVSDLVRMAQQSKEYRRGDAWTGIAMNRASIFAVELSADMARERAALEDPARMSASAVLYR